MNEVMTPDAITLQTAFQLAVGLVAFFGGFLLKTLFARIKTLEVADKDLAKEVSHLREDLPLNYSRRTDLTDALNLLRADSNKQFDAVFLTLRRIEDKVEKGVQGLMRST